MFSLVKIVLWFIFFFAWLFGKLRWNEIRTTFQDWFPFLYFIYLFLVVILPDNVQGFNFIGFVVFFFFVISIYKDFFRGLRYFISQLRVGNKSIERFDKIKRYLFKEKLEDVSEFLLAIVLIGLMYIQINYATPTISLVNKSNVELLGFIVSIFGMYGIYIGFLQYLAGDVKSDTYLGESKVNYLIGQSFWYHVTQSKIFILMLLAAIIIPVTVKLNTAFIKELTILWQTSYMLLLVIYIFLLSMSLYIIRVALLMKTKDDENLKYNMRKQIQEDYTETFWLIYRNRSVYVNDFLKNKLTRDFAKLDVNEYEEFVTNIFNLDYFDTRNLYWTILNKTERGFELTRTQRFRNKLLLDDRSWLETYQDKNEYDLRQEWKSFYKYFRTFIFEKWKFLKQYRDNFSVENWKNLILEDLKIIDRIVTNDPTLESLKIEYPEKGETRFVRFHRDENNNVREFLFKVLINKEDINLDGLFEDVKQEIQNYKENKTDHFYRYTYDFLKFRLVTILDKHENGDVNISLPEFRRLSDYDVFQNGQRNDYENSMLYSKICFNYLDRGRIEDFNQSKIEKSGNVELRKQKIKNLILSMNEEYRLAFMLYQLFYTDHTQWDGNLGFYDIGITQIMSYDEQYHYYLFNQAKKIIISETDIDHRITESFLKKLWDTRDNMIKDFSWFDQFGEQHLMSDFKILYVQWLLTRKEYPRAESRFNIEREFPIKVCKSLVGKIKGKENRKISVKDLKWRIRYKKERISCFCRDYLLLTDQLTTIFTKESYSHKQNNVQISVEYLLHSGKVNLSDVIDNISVVSLFRLEWILRWNYYQYTRESNYTSRTFFDTMTSNSRYYWSGGDGILEFYIVKIIDNFYHDLYQDREFIDGFKYHLESQLNSLNKTVEEYVESIAKKISGINNISILQKGQILLNLNDILHYQSKWVELKPKRKYRYK
ncbi:MULTISPECIES: hypothetical protein [unclassified Streptococcus]|uniref:hypothetical protein n=1 Tax=unclassified Streptococcus TaxID=2608887 RepID=UPI0007353FA0|nr:MULTISPECIES: hypothetical protein [unclassified Streptococcus]OFN54248.1 hypothetical protein HMPREF2542_04710 [Streptococcus sp. HMSC034B05]